MVIVDGVETREFPVDGEIFMYWDTLTAMRNDKPSRSEVVEFIREKGLRRKQIVQAAKTHGMQIRFTAPYWSQVNPQEFIWARLKQLFKLQPRSLHWKVRLQNCWDQIDREFELECIDRSIRFCKSMLAKFQSGEIGAVPVGVAIIAEDLDAEDAVSDEDLADNSEVEDVEGD